MPDAIDHQLKRLDHLQAITQRLAGNSFLIKGWAVTLVSAIIGFAVKDPYSTRLAWLALVPLFVLWGLDGYYLGLERAVRVIYNKGADALNMAHYQNDSKGLPEPSIKPGSLGLCRWCCASWTPATSVLYVALLLGIMIAALGVFGPAHQEPAAPSTHHPGS